jgi:hypothetical protein
MSAPDNLRDYDREICRCGHSGADHGPDEPFEDACFADDCDCKAFEVKEFEVYDGPPEDEPAWMGGVR